MSLQTPQGRQGPRALYTSASHHALVLRNSPAWTWPLLATSGRFSSLGAIRRRGQGSPSHRPPSSSREPAAPVAPGQPAAGLSSAFPFRAASTGPWPPSSPSQSPSPGSPRRGQQSPLGLGEDGPPGSEESERAAPPSPALSAAGWLQASCQPTCTQRRTCRTPGDLRGPVRQRRSRLLPVVLPPPTTSRSPSTRRGLLPGVPWGRSSPQPEGQRRRS